MQVAVPSRLLLPTASWPGQSSSRLCVACVQAPTTAAASRAAPRRAVVCAAARTSQVDVSKAVAAAALAAVIGFGQVDAAKADISGLTPCSESKAYQKRLKNELKALNKRLRNVRGATHALRQAGESTAQFGSSCAGTGSLAGPQQASEARSTVVGGAGWSRQGWIWGSPAGKQCSSCWGNAGSSLLARSCRGSSTVGGGHQQQQQPGNHMGCHARSSRCSSQGGCHSTTAFRTYE